MVRPFALVTPARRRDEVGLKRAEAALLGISKAACIGAAAFIWGKKLLGVGKRLLYCDHVEGRGERLFQIACKRDLEGIVAKRKFDPYLPDNAKWYKIRNQKYSQWIGR